MGIEQKLVGGFSDTLVGIAGLSQQLHRAGDATDAKALEEAIREISGDNVEETSFTPVPRVCEWDEAMATGV